MTLIVENGTGLSNAESYISVADADARQTALGITAWTGTDAVKEAALRRATQYMLQRYRLRWLGTRLNSTQALDWPRVVTDFVDGYYVASDAVPATVANACADLALRAAAGDLSPDQDRAIVREKVDVLETEYDRYSPQATRFVAIDAMLAPYLMGIGARLVRL